MYLADIFLSACLALIFANHSHQSTFHTPREIQFVRFEFINWLETAKRSRHYPSNLVNES